MDEEILNEEKSHLAQTLELVREHKKQLQESIKSLGAETIGRLEELRQNRETNAMDFFMHLEQLH
ncbi:MAG: hypothetical protein ACOC0N_00420 [Chroococcales cyanobacterium]